MARYSPLFPRLVVFFSCMSLLASACASQGSTPSSRVADGSSPQPAKRIVAAIQGDPSTLSRAINTAGAGRTRGVNELEELIAAGLTMLENRGDRVSQLAEEVPSVEKGTWKVFADGRMETTWRLREGVKWHDGAPLTVDDLIFTIQVGQDKELAVIGHPAYPLVERVGASDPRTVTVSWSSTFTDASALFSRDVGFPLPKHLLEPSYRRDAAGFTELPYWTAEYVAAGPYRLREFVRGARLTLDANEAYVLGKPKIGTIEVRFISDLNVFVSNLLSGDVELAIGRSLSLDHAVELRDRWPDGSIAVAPGSAVTALYPQHTNPSPAVLGDVQFRRALVHAMDRQQMIDILLHGLVLQADSVVSPAQPEYPEIQPSIVRYEHDPRRAAELIESLGFARGPNTLFRDATGRQLSVELRSTGGDDFRDKMLFTLTDQWKQVGVEAEPVIIPRQRANDREYRVSRPAFEMVSQPTDLRGLMKYHSSEMPTAENGYRGDNRARYASPALDALLDRFIVTVPVAERTRLLGEIVRHMTDRLVTLDIHFSGDVAASNKRISNVLPGSPWNAHTWDVSS